MGDIAKSGTPSLSTVQPQPANRISGLLAGEAIAAGDACYIKSDGLVWKATGAAANAAAKVRGFAAEAAAVGEAVTLLHGVTIRYGSGLTPGADYFLSTNAGLLSTTSTTGGTAPVAFAVDATRIFVFQSRY